MQERMVVADGILLVGLLAYLVWVPMPFGSTPDFAQPALIVPPLAICAGAALARLSSRRSMIVRRPARVWIAGGVLFAVVVALQLVPLPVPLLRSVSPESSRIWSAAGRVASLAGVAVPSAFPITVDPDDTTLAFFRVLAYLATFIAAFLLVRGSRRRNALAMIVASTAVFETLYAVHEASLGRYAIWGWKNTLIFGRPTGTFVNPNHFAHHAAIALPAALFLCAVAWHEAGAPRMRRRVQFARMLEKRLLLFAFGALATVSCLVSIVISQSRGATLAVIAGLAIVGAVGSGTRYAALRGTLIAVAAVAVFAAVAVVFGFGGAGARLQEAGIDSRGRVEAVVTAWRLWQRFPILGSGLGTFEDIALAAQPGDAAAVSNHAHNDYLEIAATTGTVGLVVALLPLLMGYVALVAICFGRRAVDQSWRRCAFQAAALTSLTVAMVHALFDFNFFIPANPATLAALLGAAVSARDLSR
jgi:O-antigen ligase